MRETAQYFKDHVGIRVDPSLTLVHHAHLLASRGAYARAMLTRAGVTGRCYAATIVDAALERPVVCVSVHTALSSWWAHRHSMPQHIQGEHAGALSHHMGSERASVDDVRGSTMSYTSALMETVGMHMATTPKQRALRLALSNWSAIIAGDGRRGRVFDDIMIGSW